MGLYKAMTSRTDIVVFSGLGITTIAIFDVSVDRIFRYFGINDGLEKALIIAIGGLIIGILVFNYIKGQIEKAQNAGVIINSANKGAERALDTLAAATSRADIVTLFFLSFGLFTAGTHFQPLLAANTIEIENWVVDLAHAITGIAVALSSLAAGSASCINIQTARDSHIKARDLERRLLALDRLSGRGKKRFLAASFVICVLTISTFLFISSVINSGSASTNAREMLPETMADRVLVHR
jgi:hypothetical protein